MKETTARFIAAHPDGASYGEIASHLGIAPHEARAEVLRALNKIRRQAGVPVRITAGPPIDADLDYMASDGSMVPDSRLFEVGHDRNSDAVYAADSALLDLEHRLRRIFRRIAALEAA